MTEDDIKARVSQALFYMSRGGLRASLFVDTPEEDADMIIEMCSLPKSQKPVVTKVIEKWREENAYLSMLPDRK